jgi:hypothetical protein
MVNGKVGERREGVKVGERKEGEKVEAEEVSRKLRWERGGEDEGYA